jgi:YbbR domain-containing protein
MKAAFLTRWITRDWPLKLISLALALALWLLLVPAGRVSAEKSMVIPLETSGVPEGLEIVERPVATIDVTIRAASRVLSEIGPSSLVARIDLERATVHQQEYALNASMIELPPGATVVSISPSRVTIKLEKTAEAVLELHAAVRGRPAPGYRITRIETVPDSVAVQGPESFVKAAGAATTAPVDVTGLTETTVFDTDIILPRPELRFVDTRTSARVTVVIEPTGAAPAPGAKRTKEIAK